MSIKEFDSLLKGNNAIRINEEYIIFNDYELYSFKSEISKKYKSIDELLEANELIKEIILNTKEFKQEYDGGRGSSSSNGPMGGGFNHARSRKENYRVLYPAEFNTGVRFNSFEEAQKKFEKRYSDSDIEYGISVDEQGFVHRHIQGGKTSVAISGNKGEMVIHNHPSGGNFSDSDLLSTASDHSAGIVATSSNTNKKARYTFRKNKNFKSKEFIKAVKNAKWPTQLSYDRGADWWLKKNQKKFGYTYSHQGRFND